ncbi:CDP-diacylglycerol--glycerol-3-phosphate 3-phosphatidyltransferase [Candidatus Enterovibrio escicola]|uniref:CDP-diacylglycerol--glycerol-3-phosphate 3-phosphatidyltransferase n=1 Tax=Candidatus Enterovibrio escicola TaxID=1927127 RepID=A0A2A5T128_9GAMM|nr:CDP-diacylglycerol--glycerol-3-phosphate 3-phosphatidyltransferase [Candidatus Enterovibrio escacola]PCS21864.1 CDP-diacylglycerol--glycerol-3-phosphate 3-phosphatidyltransferase [Candidatus Enterovibrio escacola]
MRLNTPIILTLTRIALIPFFVVAFYMPYQWSAPVAALIFVIAGATDWLDGYLARTLKQTTRFGAFLDPVADKVIVAIALVLIAEHYHTILVTIPAATMIAREVIISALREWMAELGKHASVAVSLIGKFKTVAQMFALTMMIWRQNDIVIYIGYTALYIATTLTYWSMYQYMLAAKDELLDTD